MQVRASVWLLGVSRAGEDLVEHRSKCVKVAPVLREPLMATPFPDYYWQVVDRNHF